MEGTGCRGFGVCRVRVRPCGEGMDGMSGWGRHVHAEGPLDKSLWSEVSSTSPASLRVRLRCAARWVWWAGCWALFSLSVDRHHVDMFSIYNGWPDRD